MAGVISYTFTSKGATLQYKVGSNTSIDIPTNITLVTKDDLQQRFFADLIKDSKEGKGVPDIIDLLKHCYDENTNIPINIAQYKTALDTLEGKIFKNPIIEKNTTEYKNMVKTSLVDGSPKVSIAKNVFYERVI